MEEKEKFIPQDKKGWKKEFKELSIWTGGVIAICTLIGFVLKFLFDKGILR